MILGKWISGDHRYILADMPGLENHDVIDAMLQAAAGGAQNRMAFHIFFPSTWKTNLLGDCSS